MNTFMLSVRTSVACAFVWVELWLCLFARELYYATRGQREYKKPTPTAEPSTIVLLHAYSEINPRVARLATVINLWIKHRFLWDSESAFLPPKARLVIERPYRPRPWRGWRGRGRGGGEDVVNCVLLWPEANSLFFPSFVISVFIYLFS